MSIFKNTIFIFGLFFSLLLYSNEVLPNIIDTIVYKGDVLYPNQIGTKISYLADSSCELTIDAISQFPPTAFIKSENDILNLRVQKKSFWLRCLLKNNSTGSLLFFEIDNPLLDHVQLYYRTSENKWEAQTISNKKVFRDRKIKSQKLIFVLDIPNGSTRDVYLNIQSNTQIALPFRIGTPDQINSRNNNEDILSGIYFGLMLVMFLYNLFIYFTVRDKAYLYYIAYILSVALVQVNLKGFGFQYLWPTQPGFEQFSLFLFPAITAFTAITFINNFLHTNSYTPRLRKGFLLFVISYIITLGIALWGNRIISYNLLNLNALPLALYMIVVAAYIWIKHKYRPAAFFLIAWSSFLLSIILFVLKELGVFPYNIFTNSFILIGSAIEALLLSFALADKINIYRKEKEIAQAYALQKAQENERIIREQNATLELKVTERTKELNHTNEELNKTLTDLKETQTQLVESEKMASLGQLTAGIAHEINNPINFVTSNVKPLRRDVDILLDLMKKIETIATSNISTEDKQKQINAIKTEYEFDYLKEEVEFMLRGINEGSTRTAEIVKSFRIFSRLDEDDLKKADVNEGLDSTIIIVNNQLNGKIKITRNYANLPLADCYPGKLNQVFLNMISNAIYAIHKKFEGESGGEIIITTQASENIVSITFADNGIGMSEATQHKLFEPFFTTKPVGEGTGLGLSISYNTIKKHHGTISVKSESDKGTEFKIEIPIIQINP